MRLAHPKFESFCGNGHRLSEISIGGPPRYSTLLIKQVQTHRESGYLLIMMKFFSRRKKEKRAFLAQTARRTHYEVHSMNSIRQYKAVGIDPVESAFIKIHSKWNSLRSLRAIFTLGTHSGAWILLDPQQFSVWQSCVAVLWVASSLCGSLQCL